MLCEHCQADIKRANEKLPAPWFDDDLHTIAGRPCERKPWQVLEILWRRRGIYTSRNSFMTLLYGHLSDPPYERIIDVFVSRLRSALGPTPWAIGTLVGAGWTLTDRKTVELVNSAADLGPIENGIPWVSHPRTCMDKYKFGELQVGQSRQVRNGDLQLVQAAASARGRRRGGVFHVTYDTEGKVRIWRTG